MFIKGAKEWIGPSARTFLLIKIFIEQKLLALGYDYFYGGIISKCSIYDGYTKILGDHFKDIFVDFKYSGTDYIWPRNIHLGYMNICPAMIFRQIIKRSFILKR